MVKASLLLGIVPPLSGFIINAKDSINDNTPALVAANGNYLAARAA
ncbi:MAG: hypothetical protein ABFQ95_01905 [Pseudomonadota bacterium]